MSRPTTLRWFAILLVDELRWQLLRPSVAVFSALYASLGVLMMIAAGGAFEGVQVGVGGGNNLVDSPYAMAATALALSLFAVMNIAAVSGGAACRDVEEGMAPLVYTTPVPRVAFLGARFAGSLAVCGVVTAAIPLGLTAGAMLPFLEPERFGALGLLNGLVPYAGWILPNVIATSALFFSIALLTRRMFPNYIGGILLLVGYLGSQALIRDLDNEVLSAMIDPFGFGAFSLQTRYWSAHERNTLLPWPTGWSLANRALWTALGLALLAGALRAARLDHDGWWPSWGRAPSAEPDPSEPAPAHGAPIRARQRFDRASRAVQLASLGRRAVGDVLGHRYFWAFVAASVLFQLLNTQAIGALYGTPTWPVTYQVLEVLEGTLQLFVWIVLTFYAGDLVWHERDLRSAALYDAAPIPDALPLAAKAASLIAVVIGLHATVPVVGVLTQLYQGYTRFEPGLYAASLSMAALEWIPFVALALAVHVLVNHKVLGHVLLVLFWIGLAFRTSLGFEYHLFWFGAHPGRLWSDMNGWGRALGPFFLYEALWLSVGLALLVVALATWVRGSDPGARSRAREAARRLTGAPRAVLAAALASAAALAAVIVWQSAVVRPYHSGVWQTRAQVRYERQYKEAWEGAPHPRATAVDLAVDLYPREGRATSSGTLTLENRTSRPIERVLLSVPAGASSQLSFDRPAEIGGEDPDLGLSVATFARPLAPGEQTVLAFSIDLHQPGFDNGGQDTTVVGNGSFVHSTLLVPGLGYERDQELSDKSERRKYGLPERPRMRDLDDPEARARNYITDDGDRVAFQAVVSTDADQIPLAPGALVEQHTEGGRRTATFRAEVPILHFFAFLSGRWEVRRDTVGDRTVEVYFQPGHDFNVDRMIEGVRDSLTAYERRFGPFQYGQIRIVEFPRYATFAQSFPSTIPYSEAIGFVARIADPDEDIDYPYYVTAHEVAHQWWAHQVIGADCQGTTILTETLAQYSALTQMRETYGPEHVHRFLRYEQDRYFQSRAVERDREVPLLRVENQPYIHYQKGGVAMYALAEAVGPDRLDAVIRSFLDRWRDRGPPYPTARDLLDALREGLPEADALLTDTFERIVLYRNRTESARARANPDGTWTVTLDVVLDKSVADEVGDETEEPFDEEIEVGVYSGTRSERTPILVTRRRLVGPEARVELVVPHKPTLAGIDPNHLLLDRGWDDNLAAVTEE